MIRFDVAVRTELQKRAIVSPGIEAPPLPCAALPVAAVPRILFGLDVEVVDVIHQVLQAVEE